MYYVTALGELLIDFTSIENPEQGNTYFEQNPGGAPANLAACISKLGGKTAFIGKVGKDMFGSFLSEVLIKHGVDTAGLKFSEEHNTTLAFVKCDKRGERTFTFYRNPGADTCLTPAEIDFKLIDSSRIFHFGSLSMTDEPARSATLKALEYAKSKNLIISYDPNLRMALWKSSDQALREITSVLSMVDILKVSEEELEFITGMGDNEKGSNLLFDKYGISLILVTRGDKGCYYRFGDITGSKPAFRNIKVIDTTGAGDAFLGGFLYYIVSKGVLKMEDIDKELLENSIVFANAVAALCTTKRGGIPAMPNINEVKNLINGDI
ncbi:carbohydrate kinase family protein [Acetivibrio clariflavus]|uniref:Sugar kinase, ribokinase n=1 Tax=Acetivibrio clariflavus (strain DSM 19732 / NBRC 101661 / EBR45) TaxID=720554 RepID=G8LU48_ACECE|nr:carbohydrate kinase [Acetivibrio clariflavus]AEV68436.1 sugar kinase, ribokinase [Acetivibrio clariflavus DSM 19732]